MLLRYWMLRWMPVVGALVLVYLLAFGFPKLVLWVFWLNGLWTPYAVAVFEWVGEKAIAPALPENVWLGIVNMLAGIRSAYNGLMFLVHATAQALPTDSGLRAEAFMRAYLAEGWLLVAQVAMLIRYYMFVRFR
jgi:hypothetical protein